MRSQNSYGSVDSLAAKIRVQAFLQQPQCVLELVSDVFRKLSNSIDHIVNRFEPSKLLLDVLNRKPVAPLIIFDDCLHIA